MSWQPGTEPDCSAQDSGIEVEISSKEKDLGGFGVRRVLPSVRRRMVGPFIFFDQMGPASFGPGEGIDVRPHPHIGLSTVTYLFDGEIMHHDSLGYHLPIRPGAVNLMVAGKGIVHSERAGDEDRARESRLYGIQTWIALPVADEETDPAFDHHPADTLPEFDVDGVSLRLIMGKAYGHVSPVRIFSPMFYLDARMPAGSALTLPADYADRAIYLADGAASANGCPVSPGTMMVYTSGAEAVVTAEQDSRVMLLGGDAVNGKRHIWWNFVSSDRARIEKAKKDWKSGAFDAVPGDDEFIPLPE